MPFPWLAVIISTSISYGLTLVAALLSPRPKAAKPDDIQVPTATEDRIKPYFVGTVRHTSPNCIWYGDFSTKKIKQTGIAAILSLGLSPSLGFKYFIGLQLDLGWGQMDSIRRIEIGGKEAWTGSVSTGTITIDKPELISSGPVKDGFQATVTVYDGNGSQTADSYVAGQVGGSVPAYKDDAYLVFKGLVSGGAYIGNSPSFPEINVDISRFPNTLGVTGGKEIIDTDDANPVCALYEFMTRSDEEFGAGYVEAQFDLTNWRAVAETIYSDGLGVSRLITGDSDVVTVIQDYLRLIDGVLNVNMQTGLIEIKLARDDYDPDTIPHFTDDDFTNISYTRGAWEDTTNEVKLSYIDRTDNFADRVAAAQDTASASGNGEVVGSNLDIEGVSNPATANKIVFRELRAISIPLGRLTASMNRNGYALAGGSVFKWTSDTYDVDSMIFRIGEVSEGKLEDGTMQLKCIQDVFALGETAFSPPTVSSWTPIDSSVTAITTEGILQQPLALHGTAQRRIFTFAKRPDASQQGYNLWTKLSTDASYSQKLTGVHFTPTGTVQTTFISGTDLTLTVTPDTDMDELPTAVSQTEIDNGDGLILIGTEILAYESYTIVGGNYVFAGVHSHSGLYGTTPTTHATTARVWFISEGAAFDTTDYPSGATVNARLLPFTPSEILAIGSASTISVTVDSGTITGVVGGIPIGGSPSDGDIIVYDAGSGEFIYETPPSSALADGDYGDVTVSGAGTVISVDSGLPAARIGTGSVDNTEFGYLNGVTSAIQTQIDLKAPLASPALTGNPTAPTQIAGNNSTRIATTAYADTAIANLINSAPGVLDTLEEIADALGDDPNFAATMTTALALKAPLASPVLTGNPTAPTPSPGDNDTSIATTAFVAAAVAGVTVSTEDVQDIVGAMVSGNSETGVVVTYDDPGGKLNFAADFSLIITDPSGNVISDETGDVIWNG